MAAGLGACIAVYWHETLRADSQTVPYYLNNGAEQWRAIAQIQALAIRPLPHSLVVFLNDPFPQYYDTMFIAALLWKDPTIKIWLQNRHQLPDGELAKANYTIDYVDGRFIDKTTWRGIR